VIGPEKLPIDFRMPWMTNTSGPWAPLPTAKLVFGWTTVKDTARAAIANHLPAAAHPRILPRLPIPRFSTAIPLFHSLFFWVLVRNRSYYSQ